MKALAILASVFLSMNKTILFFILLFFLALEGKCQINVDSIAIHYSTNNGKREYHNLLVRLQALDSALVKQDFIALYYGSVTQPNFNAAHIDSIENTIKEYNLLQEFMPAYELADSLLVFYPVSITAYFEKTFACYGLKRESEEVLSKQKYMIFSKCVLSSGNGSKEFPFQIAVYNDAIEIVKHLQLKYTLLTQEKNDTRIVVELKKKCQGENKMHFRLVRLNK